MPSRLLCVLSFLLCALRASPDVVHLKSGGKIEGRVVERGNVVEVHVGDGKMTVPRSEVVRIEGKADPRAEFEKRRNALAPEDVDGLFRFGAWCRASGFDAESESAFKEVVRRDPDHAGAREALGFSRVDGNWIRGVWQTLSTPHFAIETDCPEWLVRGLDDDLEKYYAALAEEFTANLAWRDPQKPIPIQFFRRKADYREFMFNMYGKENEAFRNPATMPRGWADAGRLRVYTHYETDPGLSQEINREIARYVLFHEANHLLWWLCVLHAPGGNPKAYREARFSWFEEGVAEYFALTRFETGRYRIHVPGIEPVRRAHLKALEAALRKGEYAPLRDFLGKKEFDFTKSDVGVMYAQAWVFTDFFFRGEDGRLRPAFWKYLGEVRQGRGGREVVESLTGRKIDAVEAAWLKHVQGAIAEAFGGGPR